LTLQESDKHKDCIKTFNESADAVDKITKAQYDKFFDKLIKDTKAGANTRNPWGGIL
jgi:hypothetical protein